MASSQLLKGSNGKPLFKHGKYLQRAAQKVKKDFEDLDSTNYSMMMKKGVKDF